MSSYAQNEVLSIQYDIWISGTKLGMSKKSCITSIEQKETVKGSDSITIQISDPDFLYIEDNIFIEENTIKVQMGWSNTTHREEFNGYISAVDINFDSDGCPKLTITCMDETHKMNRTKKNETFSNCTSASVVKKKCAEYGYTCIVEEDYNFKVQETITQSDQTDIEFITKLADDEVYPFTARLVGNTFYYVKVGKLETPKMTLTYRNYPHEIISFSPKINKESKKEEIESSSVDTSTKQVSTTTGTTETPSGSVSSGETNKPSSGGSYTYDPTAKSKGTEKWTYNK